VRLVPEPPPLSKEEFDLLVEKLKTSTAHSFVRT
jgi:hypothetical protein